MSALLRADGVRLLAEGKIDDALERFQTAVDLTIGAGTRNVYVVSSLAWLATGWRQAAEVASPLSPGERRRRLRRAKRAARRAVRYARLWPNERPHACREAGLVAALAGRPRRARRLLGQALDVAVAQGARAEWAETLTARGRVGLAAGRQDAANDLTRAEEIRQSFEAEPYATGESQTVFDVADRYRTLLDAGRRVTAAASFDELLTTVTDTAAVLLRAEQCALVHVTPDGAVVEAPGREATGTPTRALVERALLANRTVVLTQAVGDDAQSTDGVVPSGVRSALCAPIPVHGRPAACLVATHRQVAGLFGDDEVRLADFIAQLAGAAMEREHLQQDMRGRIIAAQEEERARIARDLHDEIGQALTSVLVGLRRVETSLDEDPSGTARPKQRTREVQQIASAALGQVQQLAFELRPSMLDDLGLLAAIRRVAGDIATRHSVTIDVEAGNLEVEERMDPRIEMTAYRVVQEALTNVVRHAAASSCSIVLARHDGHLRVMVEDDGCGFEPTAVRGGAFGLRGMAERAALAGGTLEVGSARGKGTAIAMDIPL
jgi:signal transduction histidine kinase